MKAILLFLTFLITAVACFCQENPSGTINIDNMQSQIPIQGKTVELLVQKYRWKCVQDRELYIYPDPYSTMRECYTVNYIYNRRRGIAYFEEFGKVRLRHLDFKKNKQLRIYVVDKNVELSYRASLHDILKIYNYEMPSPQVYLFAPYNDKHSINKNKCFYEIAFSTGENNHTLMYLYFDEKHHLRYIEIQYYNSTTVIVD